MAKDKTITFEYDVRMSKYRVKKITESTEFNPGALLDKKEVDSLCASPRWRVTVVGRGA